MITTNDTHANSVISTGSDPNTVSVTPANLRRLHRLHNRAELAAEVAQQTNAQFQEALMSIFEDAGIAATQQDGFQIDWRGGTVTLKPGEAGA